jgi:hypothetical protein
MVFLVDLVVDPVRAVVAVVEPAALEVQVVAVVQVVRVDLDLVTQSEALVLLTERVV